LQAIFKRPAPAIVFKLLQGPHIWLTFVKVPNPLRLPRKVTLQRPKAVREWCALYVLTWKSNVLRAATACTFSTTQLPKVPEDEVL